MKHKKDMECQELQKDFDKVLRIIKHLGVVRIVSQRCQQMYIGIRKKRKDYAVQLKVSLHSMAVVGFHRVDLQTC